MLLYNAQVNVAIGASATSPSAAILNVVNVVVVVVVDDDDDDDEDDDDFFYLILYVPSTIFQLNRSSWVEHVLS